MVYVRRARSLRVFAKLFSVSAIIGAVAAVGVLPALPALAATPAYTITCSGVPVIGTLSLPGSVTEGTLPATVAAGTRFNLSGYGIEITIPASLAGVVKGKQISGTIATSLAASGAMPATESVDASFSVIVPSSVPSSGVEATATGTPAPFTAGDTAGTVTLSTTGTDRIIDFTVAGSDLGSFSCTNSPEPLAIASTAVTTAPTLSVQTPGPYTVPAAGSELLSVTGSDWPAGITGGVLSWSGGLGRDTDRGTFATSSSGELSGSIALSKAEVAASSTYPFTLTLTASASSLTAEAPVTVSAVSSAGEPGVPTGVQAVAGDGSALVSWRAPASSPAPIDTYELDAYPSSRCSAVSCTGAPVASTAISPDSIQQSFKNCSGCYSGCSLACRGSFQYIPGICKTVFLHPRQISMPRSRGSQYLSRLAGIRGHFSFPFRPFCIADQYTNRRTQGTSMAYTGK